MMIQSTLEDLIVGMLAAVLIGGIIVALLYNALLKPEKPKKPKPSKYPDFEMDVGYRSPKTDDDAE